MLAEPRRRLDQIKQVLENDLGLQYVEGTDMSIGVGLGVAWSETDFLALSVSLGSPSNLYITGGIYRDIPQDRLSALEAVNSLNQDNPAYTAFLHDAEIGWDLLLQQCLPIQLFVDIPPFLGACLQPTLGRIEEAREKCKELGVAGTGYRWVSDDLQRLLQTSLI